MEELIGLISVSYRSYILTYFKTIVPMKKILNFRLLSELYSHLLNKLDNLKDLKIYISVSYRSYILTYLKDLKYYQNSILEFPSPIGVIFSLI